MTASEKRILAFKKVLELHHLTEQAFSEQIGIPQSTVNRFIRQRMAQNLPPKTGKHVIILDAYKVLKRQLARAQDAEEVAV